MGKHLPSTKDYGGTYPQNTELKPPAYTGWGQQGFVPRSLSINTSKGLKGGGQLLEDLQLCVHFGSEEGTVTEGNDPRLSNARDWSARLVTEPEATDGESEIAYKWSASLVHAAAQGWWDKSDYSTKLKDIEEGATKNKSDDYLLDRRYHTGKQPISSITGLEEALSGGGSTGSGGSTTSRGFSSVKRVQMGSKTEYRLLTEDIGKTLLFDSYLDTLEIVMPFCFGNIGDEIYFIASKAFWYDSNSPINFYSELAGFSNAKFAPQVATGLAPSFREGRSVACLKKITDDSDGMPNWLLFGDLAMEVAPQ